MHTRHPLTTACLFKCNSGPLHPALVDHDLCSQKTNHSVFDHVFYIVETTNMLSGCRPANDKVNRVVVGQGLPTITRQSAVCWVERHLWHLLAWTHCELAVSRADLIIHTASDESKHSITLSKHFFAISIVSSGVQMSRVWAACQTSVIWPLTMGGRPVATMAVCMYVWKVMMDQGLQT